MQYGILLATFKRNDGSVHCLVQGFHKLETADGQAFKNPYDCPLLELSRTIFCTPGNNVRRAVSLVHECSDSCVFLETTAYVAYMIQKSVTGCTNILHQTVTLHTMVHNDIKPCIIHDVIFGSYCIHFESGIAV